jgi:sulfofructose kinase
MVMAEPQGQQPEVVGLGHCAYDILAVTPGPPDFDAVAAIHIPELVHDGGGPVGTALSTLARLGVRAGYVGVLGNDREGRWLRDLFVQERVDISRLRLSDSAGTNICLILVEQSTARRGMLCHMRVQPHDLALEDSDRAIIQTARVLHLDGQFMPAAIQAAGWARAAAVKVCLDANHPRPRLDELLPLVDWLVVAESFPGAYTGVADLEAAARALLQDGAEVLIVTQGERGCRVWTKDAHFRIDGIEIEAKDTTGAGDAFHGGFIFGMLQGWSLYQAASFANAVAAINCQTLGGRRGLPSLSQVHRLLAVFQDRSAGE